MKRIVQVVLVVVVICSAIMCRKKDKDNDCPMCPSVESISPVSAKCYEKLTISGKNFNLKTKENIVKINGVLINPDSILSGTETQLVVKVPRGCGSGPVTVDVDVELTHFGEPPTFNYEFRYYVIDFGLKGANPPPCINGQSNSSIINYLYPTGIVADAAGNVYFSDYNYHCIFKIDTNQDSCLFAGFADNISPGGLIDDLGTKARFRNPAHMYIDNNNTIFVAENSTSIRTISPSGNVATYTTDTNLNYSSGIAFQPGNTTVAYVSVKSDHIISKITRQGTKLVTTRFAGKNGDRGYVDGIASVARFSDPEDVAVDNQGNVFVSDRNHVIRKITPGGVTTTFAGNGTPNFADGQGTQASFNKPEGMFIDSDNTIYVADSENNCIRKITPEGLVSTIFTFTGGMHTPSPHDIVRDKIGNFYITFTSTGGQGVKKLAIF
jgi:hypothetical protein